MKKILNLFLVSSSGVYAQTGIGTTSPNAAAKLDITSANKGFLPPRVALTSSIVFAPVTGLSGPTELAIASGLLVYNTNAAGTNPNNVVPGYYYLNGYFGSNAGFYSLSSGSGSWWGTLISNNSTYSPAQWIGILGGSAANPGIIWYWVR